MSIPRDPFRIDVRSTRALAGPKFVAIGGTGEGLSAVAKLVGLIPPETGLIFAVVLEPDTDEARVTARLSEQTAMPIVTVSEPLHPKPDHIYIASRGNELTFADHQLVPIPPLATNGARCSVDRLFRCIASEYGPASAAVVVAGTGADGAIGLKLIKEGGGVTFAQTPGEQLPDEMSRLAIATGFVDFVLPLSDIATQLANIEHPTAPELLQVQPDDLLRELLVLLRVRTGHDFTQYKRATLLRRVARRMQVTSSTTLDDYLRVARQEPTELAALLRDFMISVTNFFRDPDAFGVIEHTVIPQLFDSNSAEPIRIWVAGCASGEEVYSLAILLLEARATIDPTRTLQIFATDIDDSALIEARAGRYPNTIAADVSAERLERFFTRDGEYFQVKKEMRELVLFASHNLLRDSPFSRLDMMTCRNLLIYLDRPMQEQVLRTAHFSLKAGRFLFLGSSENADTADHLFEPMDPKNRVYERQAKRGVVLPTMNPQPRWSPPPPPISRQDVLHPPSLGEVHYRMVERYAPPSILVNPSLEICHISQRANRYLEAPPGEPTRDIFQMVIAELRLDLRAAVYAARRKPGVVVSAVARAQIDGEPRLLRIGVHSEAVDPAHANTLVWFEEEDIPPDSSHREMNQQPVPQIEPFVQQLEDELRHARDQLRSTVEQYETLVEELHASNEELQAINEELRSASEEIEASREETDSVNQELTTVNQELKHRIEETTAAKSDIANLMESSDIGVVFVDRELRIHRFTQRAREIFNVRDSDVGRPLSDLASNLRYPELEEDARSVLESLKPVEREVQHANANRYLVRVRPYRTLADRIAGLVMTFVDITALRRTEDALRNKEAMLGLAERAANAGAWELDPSGRLRMSEQCHDLYGTPSSSTALAIDGWMANVRVDDRRRLQEAIDRAIRGELASGLDIEFAVEHPKHGERWLWMIGRKSEPNADLAGIAGITLDVTAARLARRSLEAADRRKNEFIATLAHELRNPLTPLTMALDIQKASAGNVERIETARAMMERQVGQLKRLVDDLLDVSRIQTGRLELRVEARIPLEDILTAACETVRPLIDEQRHRLVVNVPNDIYLDADPMRLSQVFVNLLTNAAKYTEAGGTITLDARKRDDSVAVTIADTGIGIAPDLLPKIFDLFVQAEPILTRARGGIGIGLALVKQLVVLHGGSIAARSAGEGKGSCFIVNLPVHQSRCQHESEPAV